MRATHACSNDSIYNSREIGNWEGSLIDHNIDRISEEGRKIEVAAMCAYTALTPVVSKIFCSSSHAVLMVRRRPPAVNGGGFVVTDRDQRVVFSVDGCGIIGASGQLIVRDGDGTAILFIHKKGGVVQALSINNWWKGYLMEYGEPSKLVFSLQDPKPVLCMKGDVRVTVEPKGRRRHWDYEVTGSFAQRACAVKSRAGHVVAQVKYFFTHCMNCH
ncbi:hypothetical protein GUJ93_ZPchr0006g43409 [Zizania palustris]|uniref:Uncharacterized protein n=1 Tax=Zizania palustris TaxID=103762 RepID=A0A8J5SDD8_ZIZPA|nr:hypothetical protein GUJ93_ZPchr0006g43409 [Zizania palustris]